MALIISQIKTAVDEDKQNAVAKAIKKLRAAM